MMTQVRTILAGWMNDEEGATMVEYGLLVALIAAVVITAVIAIGNGVNGAFGKLQAAAKW